MTQAQTVTQEDFNEQYGEILLHGLSSTATYIPLRTNKSQGINVAIRPIVRRLSDGVVLFGGTLRVGFTLDGAYGSPVKANVVDINEESRMERLKDFCKGFSWRRQDHRRFSTIVGIAFAATRYDRDGALEALDEGDVAKDFITRLENTYKQYNDVGFTANKRQAVAALNAAWLLQSEQVFSDPLEYTPLPEAIVGRRTGVLNQAQDKYGENVVAFTQKVTDWAEAAAEEAAEDEDNNSE